MTWIHPAPQGSKRIFINQMFSFLFNKGHQAFIERHNFFKSMRCLKFALSAVQSHYRTLFFNILCDDDNNWKATIFFFITLLSLNDASRQLGNNKED
jgi:hypothetical protein